MGADSNFLNDLPKMDFLDKHHSAEHTSKVIRAVGIGVREYVNRVTVTVYRVKNLRE